MLFNRSDIKFEKIVWSKCWESDGLTLSFSFHISQMSDDYYRMQSQPLGICLIIDCIGNDTGKSLEFKVP